MASLFNELLADAGIAPADVRLLRHHTKAGIGGQSLHDLWLNDRSGFELYQTTQDPKKKLFRSGPVWAAFTSPSPGRTLFTGLYDARFVERTEADWKCPYRGGAPGRGKPVDVFETNLRPELKDLIGRLEVEWDPAKVRNWARYAVDAPLPVIGAVSPHRTVPPTSAGGLATALLAAGFTERHRTQKVVGYGRAGVSVYLKENTRRHPLVIHPLYFDLADRLDAIPGVEFERPLRPYIDSNMRSLAVYETTERATRSRYGFAISAAASSIPALVDVLMGARTMVTVDGRVRLMGDDENPLTEKERLATARIGQGEFRSSLMGMWNGACPVLGVDHPALLRASHIKPWRSSKDRERLDPYNGLLLSTHVDALFDSGLISFSDDGDMLISSAIGRENLARMGISANSTIGGLDRRHAAYLAHHRSDVFLG